MSTPSTPSDEPASATTPPPASGGSWRPWVYGILSVLVLGRTIYRIANRVSESDRAVEVEISRQGEIDKLMVNFDLMEMRVAEARWGDGSAAAIKQADDYNEAAMKELFRPHWGWPPSSLLPKGHGQAVRLLARCSFAYQQERLPFIEVLRKNGEVREADYARLLDAMAVNSGQEQLFGTAAHFGPDKQLVRHPLREPEKVAERRQAMGLPTLAEEDAAWAAERKAHGEAKPVGETLDAAAAALDAVAKAAADAAAASSPAAPAANSP